MTEQQPEQPAQSFETTHAREVARGFAESHGKPVKVVVENFGRSGARMVLVAPNGRIGDVIVPDVSTGNAVIAAEDDLEAAEWDSATVAQTTIGSQRRRSMGHSATRG